MTEMGSNGSSPTITIRTEDPGVRGVRSAVKAYVKESPDLADQIKMYGAIMEIQQEALKSIQGNVEISKDKMELRLRGGEPILNALDTEVDHDKFSKLVVDISSALDEKAPGGFSPGRELGSWQHLGTNEFDGTRARVLNGEELDLPEDWKQYGEVLSSVIWEALTPFYRAYGKALEKDIDHSAWQKGLCPVCGCRPFFGMFRGEDGLWILECALCHKWWYVHRADCPFCLRPSGKLEYLYLEQDSSKRVQYCSECRRYVKTINLRDTDKKVLLPLEDIVTYALDEAAKTEDLKRVDYSL